MQQANWGPNATTFVIPAELFPTKWKSTGHGISAAAGKAGAIIGAFGFLFASQPALNEVTWKFPCVNTPLVEYVTFAKSGGASPTVGGAVAMTAYFQNIAVPGFPNVQTSKGTWVAQPWKNSLVLPSDLNNNNGKAAWVTAYNAAHGTSYLASGTGAVWNFGTATSGTAANSTGAWVVGTPATYVPGVYADFFFNTSVKGATPEGITNPNSYAFPQVGINGPNSACPQRRCFCFTLRACCSSDVRLPCSALAQSNPRAGCRPTPRPAW